MEILAAKIASGRDVSPTTSSIDNMTLDADLQEHKVLSKMLDFFGNRIYAT